MYGAPCLLPVIKAAYEDGQHSFVTEGGDLSAGLFGH